MSKEYYPIKTVTYAHWEEYSNENDKGFHYCTNCGSQAFNYSNDSDEVIEVLSDFCPNCGAYMLPANSKFVCNKPSQCTEVQYPCEVYNLEDWYNHYPDGCPCGNECHFVAKEFK